MCACLNVMTFTNFVEIQVHEASLHVSWQPAWFQLQHRLRWVHPWRPRSAESKRHSIARLNAHEDHAERGEGLLWPGHQRELVSQATPTGQLIQKNVLLCVVLAVLTTLYLKSSFQCMHPCTCTLHKHENVCQYSAVSLYLIIAKVLVALLKFVVLHPSN